MINKETAKLILDRWGTVILRTLAIHEENGESRPNLKKAEDYTPDKYSEDICLWIPPKDCIRLEFENDPETNQRCVREVESVLKSLAVDYCITGHGGKSDYINIFNLKGIPVNEDNPIAKNLFIDTIASNTIKQGLDRSNLGWTYSPVIGHAHWKKKYGGAIHDIIRGKNPIEHENEYPKKLLKQIEKSKITHKYDVIQVQQNYPWVNNFLLNYCVNNKLPVGNRNHIIEKNMAVLLVHHKDRDYLMAKYFKTQERKHNSLAGWFNKVIKGEIKHISLGELKRYIQDNNIHYAIPSSKDEPKKPEMQPITDEEHIILTDENLLSIIDDELDKTIVGEHESRKAIILNACGKYVENANISSYNLCINSNSGAGKDYITKNTLKIFPDDDIEIRSRISPTAFTYWHNSRFEPEWTWDNKILVLLDISNTILNCEVFKVMCSDGSHSTVVIEQRAVDIKINGKPVMFITTASASPKSELLRRFPFMQLDETVDQTKAIKKAQAKAAAEGKNLVYNPLITNALSKLKRVRVKIPFAGQLVDAFPDEHIIMRTHFSRLLDYIKASAALYQYQREKDADGFLIAQSQDYDNARIPLNQTTSNPIMIPLSKKQRMLLEECKKLGSFTVKTIEPNVPFLAQSKIYASLDKLQEYGFLRSFIKEKEESKRPVRYYEYIDFQLEEIPTWEEIKNNCRKKGNEGIEEIKGIKGNEGINGNQQKKIVDNDNSRDKNRYSPYSLNSPPILTSQTKNFFKSQDEKIKELRQYFDDTLKKGIEFLTYEALCYSFDRDFIEECKKRDIIIRHQKSEDGYILGGK